MLGFAPEERSKMNIRNHIAISLFALMSPALAGIYDDFSSKDLGKWEVEQAPGNEYAIEDGLLVLRPSPAPAYGVSTYTSVKTDFSLARSASAPLQLQVVVPAGAFASTSDKHSGFRFGFKDEDGHTILAGLHWIGPGFGGWKADIVYDDNVTVSQQWMESEAKPAPREGDTMTLTWDGEQVALVWESGGRIVGKFAQADLKVPFGDKGAILFQYNNPPGSDEGEESYFKMRSIGIPD